MPVKHLTALDSKPEFTTSLTLLVQRRDATRAMAASRSSQLKERLTPPRYIW